MPTLGLSWAQLWRQMPPHRTKLRTLSPTWGQTCPRCTTEFGANCVPVGHKLGRSWSPERVFSGVWGRNGAFGPCWADLQRCRLPQSRALFGSSPGRTWPPQLKLTNHDKPLSVGEPPWANHQRHPLHHRNHSRLVMASGISGRGRRSISAKGLRLSSGDLAPELSTYDGKILHGTFEAKYISLQAGLIYVLNHVPFLTGLLHVKDIEY